MPEGVPTLGVTVQVIGGMAAKLAMTVQSAVIATVWYKAPVSVPPQVPPTESIWKPAAAAKMKVVVSPSLTVRGVVGEIVPEGVPTLGVTTRVVTLPPTIRV